MRPGIVMVFDHHLRQAEADVDWMLRMLGAGPDDAIVTESGSGWAVAAIAPPSDEPTSGAAIHTDGRDWLIWAGEMFTPREWRLSTRLPLREAISRVVLHHLQEEDTKSLARINGAFCGAWYDSRRRRWVVFNDKMGLLPIFWSANQERLVVSPRAWLTWRASKVPLTISGAGVANLVRTHNMVDDHTLIEDVFWLPRGNVLLWSDDESGYEQYWDLQYIADTKSQEEAVTRYVDVLHDSIERHSDCESPLLLGISGGLDARLFLAMCREVGRVPHCFTSGWPFYEDVRFGRKLARLAGARHTVVPLDADTLCGILQSAIIGTDGLQSAACLTPVAVAQDWLRHHRGSVLLEGFFHGMIGGCTVPADDDVLPERPAHESHWARSLLHAGGGFDLVNGLLHPELGVDSYQEWCERVDTVFNNAPGDDPVGRAEFTMVSARRGRIDVLGTALQRDHVLVRNPAGDAAMLNWHEQTPAALRRARRVYLEVLRTRYPEYARVPRADGCWGLPIARDRWRREYHWQFEKLHRAYVHVRYPFTRRCGSASKAIRAWTFDVWRRTGALDILLAPDARVLNWVRRDALVRLWDEAVEDPAKSEPLLTLGTLETMMRWLERSSGQTLVQQGDRSWFQELRHNSRKKPSQSMLPVAG